MAAALKEADIGPKAFINQRLVESLHRPFKSEIVVSGDKDMNFIRQKVFCFLIESGIQ